MKVFVGEGSIMSSNEKFIEAARYIGKYLGENHITYIQGNCINGLMGETYKEYSKYSDDVVMYGMKGDNSYKETKELLPTFDARTMKIIYSCDVAIFLPGGDCTIQEITTFNQYNREYPDSHKLIIVNIDGFFNPLIDVYKRIVDDKLNVSRGFKDSFIIVDSIEEAIKYIK